MEYETDEPAELLKALVPKCSDDKTRRAYYKREDGTYLTVCNVCGDQGTDHLLPPGYKPSGHAFIFSAAKFKIDMEEMAGTAQEPV